MPPKMLGQNLRALRLRLGRSLVEVAEATDISPSFLSMVENGNSDIALGRLLRLTQFYGVQIADVVPGSGPEHQVIHPDDRQRLVLTEEGLDIQFLADPHHPLRPLLVRFEPGGGMIEPVRDAGDAFLYVLEGEVIVTAEGAEPVVLGARDSAYFPAERGRLYHNRTEQPSLLLSVVLRQDAVAAYAAGESPAQLLAESFKIL
jgi:transcriptional regulator with XRE-family HTH domain